jgi:amino acid transporter
VVVLGNVSQADLVKYADTAVAQAARPVLGNVGFIAVSIAALLATASAINAVLFSGMNIALGLGKGRQLPSAFTSLVRGKLSRGVTIAIAGVLVMVNFMDLSSIADVASAAFLITYLAVFVAHWRLAAETASSRPVIAIGFALMATVLAAFEISVFRSQWISLLLTFALVGAAIVIEMVLANAGRPEPKPRH